MSGQFKQKLFGCFDNCSVCICVYFLPCYVEGKIAEKVGESCCLHGCLMFVPIANFICLTKIRGLVRQQKGIDGSCCNDFLLIWFCGLCALSQEAVEVDALDKGAMARE